MKCLYKLFANFSYFILIENIFAYSYTEKIYKNNTVIENMCLMFSELYSNFFMNV